MSATLKIHRVVWEGKRLEVAGLTEFKGDIIVIPVSKKYQHYYIPLSACKITKFEIGG